MSGMQGSARQEAERLVATVLAMASQGRPRSPGWSLFGDAVSGLIGQATGAGHGQATGAGHGQATGPGHDDPSPVAAGGWATGSAECCVCPVCRVIAGLRDPDPAAAERLATGAGDFAAGVASLLRAFAPTGGDEPAHRDRLSPQAPAPGLRTGDDPWASATAAGHDPTATVPRPVRTAAPSEPPDASAPAARARDPWAAATAVPQPGGSGAGAAGTAGPVGGGDAASPAAAV